jgi:hypothetical protein
MQCSFYINNWVIGFVQLLIIIVYPCALAVMVLRGNKAINIIQEKSL